MAVTAVVPLKALPAAKGRLSAALSPAERGELVAVMLGVVLHACLGARAVDDVLVVAGDEDAAELARRWPVKLLMPDGPGLNTALAAADRWTATAPATLVVAADLPLVSAADLDAVCQPGQEPGTVVVAASSDGGTAALLRRPPGLIPPAFGPHSAATHLRLARRAGARAVRLDLPGLALDVDTPAQLRAAAARSAPLGRWAAALG